MDGASRLTEIAGLSSARLGTDETMSAPDEVPDINLIWIREWKALSADGFDIPTPIGCASLTEALEQAAAESPLEGAQAWIYVRGTLFGPAQIDVLRRLKVRDA